MTTDNIRVLVVDDSAVIRTMICDNITAEPGMEVAGTARSGQQALDVFESVRPDVVTLDIQMPGMDGLETLDALLTRHPVPVIMVSSLTRAGADVTLDALERGALDYVAKPERGADAKEVLGGKLLQMIRSAAGTDVQRILQIRRDRKQRRAEKKSRKTVPTRQFRTAPESLADKCIVIGISTGGPPALASLFEMLQPPMPAVVVVQHMPPSFTRPFAWRLNSLSALSIKEAAAGDKLRPNHVLIAPGGKHLGLRGRGKFVKALLKDGPTVSGHKPSVDVLMADAAEIFGSRCLGVVMTGMGRDGAQGCADIRAAGGYTLGQDEATSDVYGMNKVAFVEGNIDQQFALDNAAAVVGRQVKRLWCGRVPAAVG